jgi:hypothetical protein
MAGDRAKKELGSGFRPVLLRRRCVPDIAFRGSPRGTPWNSVELRAIVWGWRTMEARPMSSGSAAKEFEAFARDCVQLAAQADTPELRERLLSMARDWMRAAMEEDGAAPSTNRVLQRRRLQPSRGAA